MRILRSADSFDRYVSLKSKSQSKYRTCCGGIMTIIIFILMLVYLIVLITNPLEIKKTTSSNTSTGTNTTATNTTTANTTSNPTTTIEGIEFEAITDFRTYSNHTTRTDNTAEYDLKSGGWAIGLHFITGYDPKKIVVDFFTIEYSFNTTFPTQYFLNTTV